MNLNSHQRLGATVVDSAVPGALLCKHRQKSKMLLSALLLEATAEKIAGQDEKEIENKV